MATVSPAKGSISIAGFRLMELTAKEGQGKFMILEDNL
jgi:hypothetical protein